ncbi:hypothetical protein RB597_007662 [Gaeumannomyces tritici]
MPDYDKSRELPIKIFDEPHLETLKRAISNIISTQAAETANLCPGVLEKVHEFRDAFQPEILKFDSSVLLAYQAAGLGSRAFNTRLIELVALAVHQIAVILFNLDTSLHKEDGVIEWVPPKDDWRYWDKHLNGPLPTLMYHPWYVDFEQYPEGAADMVGFWA